MTSANLEQSSHPRGLGRRGYWIAKCVVHLVLMGLLLDITPEFLVVAPAWTACAVYLLWATLKRLENLSFSKWWAVGVFAPVLYVIGFSEWWPVALLVPVVHIIISVGCLVGPENYANRDEIDDLGALLVVPSIFALGWDFLIMLGGLELMTQFLPQ